MENFEPLSGPPEEGQYLEVWFDSEPGEPGIYYFPFVEADPIGALTTYFESTDIEVDAKAEPFEGEWILHLSEYAGGYSAWVRQRGV